MSPVRLNNSLHFADEETEAQRDKAASIPLMKGSGPSLEAGGSWLLSGGRAHLRAPPGEGRL